MLSAAFLSGHIWNVLFIISDDRSFVHLVVIFHPQVNEGFPRKEKKGRKKMPDPHLGQDPISDFSKFPCPSVTRVASAFRFQEPRTRRDPDSDSPPSNCRPTGCHWVLLYGLFFSIFIFLSFVFFLGPHQRHTEVPRVGVECQLLLPVYTTATAMPDLNCVFDLHRSQPRGILNPLRGARDRTGNLVVPSQIHFHCAMMGTPCYSFQFGDLRLFFLPQ